MRPEEMMEGIRHIEDAHVDAGARRCPPKLRSPWGMIASAACLCLVIAGVVFLRGAGLLTPATQPTEPGTTAPTTAAPTTLPPTTEAPTTIPPTTDGPTKNGVPIGWIIEEDTSISGEVTFAVPFKGSQGMDAMIEEFNKIYPNIKINLFGNTSLSDGSAMIRVAIMTGEVQVWTAFGHDKLFKMWETELGYDLTNLVAQEGINLTQQWGTDAYTYNDKIYSFPCGGLSYYVAINMDAWKEAGLYEKYNGLPTEWTWDEYIEASRLMTKVNDDGTIRYGGSDYHSTNYFMYTHCQVNGGDMYYDVDGSSSYDNPIVLEALERKLRAEREEGIWYPLLRYRTESRQAQMAFCEGEVASTIIPNVTRFLHNRESFPNVDWVTGFAPFPVMEKGQTNYMSGVPNSSHVGISSYIDEERLPAAWAFVKWYATYGSKYLAAAGYQSTWRGTEAGELLPLIYGSAEEAAKWVDVESFDRVVGRADLPAYQETTLTAYSDVSGALRDPIMQCINGEITPEECLKQAWQEAEKALEESRRPAS